MEFKIILFLSLKYNITIINDAKAIKILVRVDSSELFIVDKKANKEIGKRKIFFVLKTKKSAKNEENKKVNPDTILVNSMTPIKYKR